MARGPNGAAVPTRPSSPAAERAPDLFAHQPPPRADGRLPITVTHLAMVPADWTRRGLPPDIDVTLEREAAPTAAFYRDLYDRVGLPWLWYERRLLSDAALSALLAQPRHELHVARHDGALVGYFELADDELVRRRRQTEDHRRQSHLGTVVGAGTASLRRRPAAEGDSQTRPGDREGNGR